MISRRRFLRSSATAAVVSAAGGGVMPMPSDGAVPDPCLAFVTAWNSTMTECEAIAHAHETDDAPNAFWKANVGPFFDRANAGDVPHATTAEGAAAALQRVLDWEDMEDQDAALVRAALAFLQKGAST